MKSLILQTSSKLILPLMMIFSFFLLLRGHNEPGGGFIGGLVASAGFILYSLAFSVEETKSILKVNPLNLIITGLLIALFSGIYPLLFSKLFMTGLWTDFELPIIGKLGTPFIFDIGVYFVVLGIAVSIIFSISEEVTDK